MTNQVPIFSLSIAQELLKEGFKVINIKQNSNFPSKLVFYFEKTPQFIEHLKKDKGINIRY